nr:abietadienol/abietadienal oxidase [Tanacetum cinerariifolium]
GDSIRWYNAVASSNPTTFVQEQVLRYGKIFSCNIFGRKAVVSTDPIFNRFVMHNEGKLFKSSYPKSFRDLVGSNGVITAQGDQHRKLHTIASNMMRPDTLKTRFLTDIQLVMNQTFAHFHHHQTILLQDVCRKYYNSWSVNGSQLLSCFESQLMWNMCFNESEECKKTFIGSSVGTGSMQVLHGFEFEVEPLGDHTFEVEPQENVDQGAGLQEVQTQDLIYYHLARDREQHLACELFGYREDINEAAFAVVV